MNKLIGEVFVLEIRGVKQITSDHLNKAEIPKNCSKLILKTDNQQYWEDGLVEFQKDFCSIDKSGAQWLVDMGIHLIGIDYLSIQRYYDGPETHQILLNSEIIIIECLNLEQVQQGNYELICLPLNIEGIEGSPVRALLKKI